MKKTILLFGIILGTVYFQAVAGVYATQENYDYKSFEQKFKLWMVLAYCGSKEANEVEYKYMGSYGFGAANSSEVATDVAIKECTHKKPKGSEKHITFTFEHPFDTVNDYWLCFYYYWNSSTDGMYGEGKTQDEADYNLDDKLTFFNKFGLITAGRYCRYVAHEGMKDFLKRKMDEGVAVPEVKLDSLADKVDGHDVTRVGTITNVETVGSAVKYEGIISEDNPDGTISLKPISNEDYSIEPKNGELVFEVHPKPEFRNKWFGVVATRISKNKISKLSTNFVPLRNMCKPFDKLDEKNGKCFTPIDNAEPELVECKPPFDKRDENGKCSAPPLPKISEPEIRVTSDNAADGSKIVEISMMERGATFRCVVTDDKEKNVLFRLDDCRVDNSEGAYMKRLTVGAALNGKHLKIFAEKNVPYGGSKAHVTANSNTVLLEDTVAKNCTYMNPFYSKKEPTDSTGTKCYPYPSCDALTSNDIPYVLFGAENGGGHVFELEYKDDISLPDRHIEVLNYENKSGTIKVLPASDDIKKGFVTRKVRDEVVLDPHTAHYDYMLYRICKNGQEKSPGCRVGAFTNGSYTVCGDQR